MVPGELFRARVDPSFDFIISNLSKIPSKPHSNLPKPSKPLIVHSIRSMAPKTRGSSRGGAGMKRKRTVRRPARESSPSSDSSSSSTPNAPPVGATSEVDHYASRVITTGRKFDFNLFEREG